MVEVPETPGNDNDILDALAFLTATYDTEPASGTGAAAMGGLIESALEDAMASTDDPAQKLLNGITALTNVLGGMTVLARALLDKCAELMAVEPAEILGQFGRQLKPPPTG
jgi:hypothetical protein